MQEMILNAGFVLLCGFLYRFGGGGFKFLPFPFNQGFKAARRYALPLAVAFFTGWWFPMCLYSLILHFNLDEIAARRWDDVACYGFAQAFCFVGAGQAAGLLGAWWFCATYFSNNNFQINFKRFNFKLPKLDWFYVELVQGLLVGLLAIV